MFFCRHRDSVAQAFRSDVTYMPAKPASEDTSATFNPLTHSAQWSRRFIGLKLFMALAQYGEAGYAEMLDHSGAHGRCAARVANGYRLAHRKLHAASSHLLSPATVLLHPNWLLNCASARSRGCPDAELGGTPVVRACITSFKTTERRHCVGRRPA